VRKGKGPSEVGLGASYDVVVIGSGFGGSISANRLSLSGLNVLVLERGPWRDSLPVSALGIPERSPFPYRTRFPTHIIRSINIGHANAAGSVDRGNPRSVREQLRDRGFRALRSLAVTRGRGVVVNKHAGPRRC
jgi:choline dehydrogenase-like flavoprotein